MADAARNTRNTRTRPSGVLSSGSQALERTPLKPKDRVLRRHQHPVGPKRVAVGWFLARQRRSMSVPDARLS